MAYTQALLDAIDAEILSRITGGAVESYSMPDGRSLRYLPMSELRALRTEVATEVAAASGGTRSYGSRRRPL
jgi:hypothetical protein